MKRHKKIRHFLPYYIMFLPALFYMIINNFMPIPGLLLAFQKVNLRKGILGGEWIRFDNFRFLFATQDAWVITRNTIGYNLLFMIMAPVFGILVAICMNSIRSKWASRFSQTAILLPYLMSMVVVSYFGYAILNPNVGIANQLLRFLGFSDVQWYTESGYWTVILPIINLWHSIGFTSVIYLSSLVGISSDYYEAADIDGATGWQKFWYITLPMLKPTIITLTIISLGRMFRSDFGLFYQVPLDSGALYRTTQTIDTYVYRGLANTGNIGMSAAAGFYQSIVGFAVILLANQLLKKVSPENTLY